MDQAVMNRPAIDPTGQSGAQGSAHADVQDSVIVADGLTKVYGDATAVDHISFKVGRGEIFGLLGPNGAGKTTTILMMLGLTDISSGEVSVLGFNPAREPLSVKRRVGYLPDTVGFYDYLSAADNMRYTARLIGFPRAEREKRIAEALERVGLSDVADNRVSTFSRGMRQRLGLAEILMKGAQIAILDEPTSGLDPQATTELLAIIRGFKAEGVSVLLSSHLLERVQVVCDRVALFSAGKIALMGTVAELGRQVLGGGYTVDIEADGAGLAERLALIPGVSGVEKTGVGKLRLHADRDVRPEAAAEVVAMQGRLKFLGVQEPSLEAIYTRYFESKSEAPLPPQGARHAA
jgi:ABC-2 type transport system ATP-binding protein